jgi:hypothetical protein
MATIQFNLLPDVKAQYISTERNRRLVNTIAMLATAVCLGIFLLVLFTVDVVQKKQLSDADSDIKDATSQLKDINGLSQIVTVRNQLDTLSSLHQKGPAVSRIFTYMPQVTPAAANMNSLSVDFVNNVMQISGSADTQATVNAYVDTLKYATYKTSEQDTEHNAFTSVVLTSFSVTPGKASYSLNAKFDPVLFANPLGAAPKLNVKNQVTTRSVLDDPSNFLFNSSSGGGK